MSLEFENDDVLNSYRAIANEIIAFIGNMPWDEAGGKYIIFDKMVQSGWWRKDGSNIYKAGKDIPDEIGEKATDSIRFLKKHLLSTTGDRIWGLIFTLYPSGKFTIEYDYNFPEDYEESDKTISGDEINKSLMELNNKINGKI